MATDHPQPSASDGWVGHWLGLLLDTARDYAVILLDPQGHIVAWLKGAEHIFGFTPDEALGQPLALIFTPEDRQAAVPHDELATVLEVGQAQDDRWHVRKDGSRFWGSGATIAVRERDGRLLGFGKLVRDRTDWFTQVETLNNRVRLAWEECQRQDVVLATLAHELRNPLQPLRNAAVTMETLAANDPRLLAALKVVDRQVGALTRLLDDIMDAAQLKTGKLRLSVQRMSLQRELLSCIAGVEPAAQDKGVDLRPVLPAADVQIELDRDRFQQIVVNLLNNAIKFTPRGGTVWIKATVDSGHASVRILDTGCGIPPEVQPHIFQLFTQGLNAPSGRTGGLGLGLTLVKELVSQHHGTVAVRSEGVGKGSEFTVRLPLVQRGDAAPPEAGRG